MRIDGDEVQEITRIILVITAVLLGGYALADIDLRNADVSRLDNGLTVILLEDRNFPVISTQMLYRIGARNESYGETGIAHFLEHMAFRASENFPDTGLVSSIYAVGGEWHGYTWTDQTTYFATVPKEHLDLLLRIEADRMTRVEISRDVMEAERGAVLAEMHMYENYPTSMLLDAIMFTSFLGHPYRNNTIGWESDIEGLRHEEVVAFYEQHYQPANAVLAVVGDFQKERVRARIEKLFSTVPGKTATPLPRTVEPVQAGERRVRLNASTDEKRFMVAYRAPSTNHADFAAFLVLQEVLGAGSGVNFRQNDWGTPVRDDSVLAGIADGTTTWYPPSAQDYIFIIGGTLSANGDESQLEKTLEERVARMRHHGPDQNLLTAAIARVQDELVFDVQTTEDAAHQLAFFAGLQALDNLLELPDRVAAVSAADVQRVAATYLSPERRTIGWHVPDSRPTTDALPGEAQVARTAVKSRPVGPVASEPMPLPLVRSLSGGIPVIVQPSNFSSTAYVQIVVRGTSLDTASENSPILGHSSLSSRFRPHYLQDSIRELRADLDGAGVADSAVPRSTDPETRLEQTFAGIVSDAASAGRATPAIALILLSGDVDADHAIANLEDHFGALEPRATNNPDATPRRLASDDIAVHLGVPVAQAQLGYIVPAPGPRGSDALAWQILLYILSHDYEGRLGKEAISNRGLAYYIDSRYRSDGDSGWVTLAVGVDPDKLIPLKDLLHTELQRLRDDPPTIAEIEEAKRYLLGRARSAAQSNEELSTTLARQWLWYGDVITPKSLDRMLGSVDRQAVLDAVPAFIEGVTIVVAR